VSWLDSLSEGSVNGYVEPPYTLERRAAEQKRRQEDDARRQKEASERLAALMRARVPSK
jgi:hypothetical protein